MAPTANLYDTVPYPSRAFLQTHPDRLAVAATLFGMNPPPVEKCRVLEIACGDGSNLIPMAFGLPRSEFVGIDLAATPVEIAQGKIRRLALKNIDIHQMNLMEIEPSFGQFDYIIAHGVYAWVPGDVQRKILDICSANLSASGVAFVSYNTYPAGHVRNILREIMQFHERRSQGTADPVRSAKMLLESVLEATDQSSPWRALLQEEWRLVFNRDERVVYHDDLAECFSPVLFADFLERAAVCGLQFLSEAQLSNLLEPDLRPEALGALKELAKGDAIAYQQYLDFARYRRFRQTLLCHAEISLRHDVVLEGVQKMLIASPMTLSTRRGDGAVEFTNSRGAGTLTTNDPAVLAMLQKLEAIWPRAERFDALCAAVVPSPQPGVQDQAIESLSQTILKLAKSQLVDLRTYDLPLAARLSEKPTASLLARAMAEAGTMVTTLLHTHLDIEDEQGRRFLQLLDGTRNRHELTDVLAKEAPNNSQEMILSQVDGGLITFYRMGLLVA